jgi:hypothetical protein
VIDNDFVPYGTSYDVRMEVVDAGDNVLDSSLLSATTPAS